MASDSAAVAAPPVSVPLPSWAREAIQLYESNAASQFVLYGNVYDQMLIPVGTAGRIGTLTDFLLQVMLPRFDVVFSYDLGNGIRVEKGGDVFSKWPQMQQDPEHAQSTACRRRVSYSLLSLCCQPVRGSIAKVGRWRALFAAPICSLPWCREGSTTI